MLMAEGGPIEIYAHTCKFEDEQAIFDNTISPEDYASESKRWLEHGAQIIGGCCGVRKEHICALQKLIWLKLKKLRSVLLHQNWLIQKPTLLSSVATEIFCRE
jgi:hypothetical protein